MCSCSCSCLSKLSLEVVVHNQIFFYKIISSAKRTGFLRGSKQALSASPDHFALSRRIYAGEPCNVSISLSRSLLSVAFLGCDLDPEPLSASTVLQANIHEQSTSEIKQKIHRLLERILFSFWVIPIFFSLYPTTTPISTWGSAAPSARRFLYFSFSTFSLTTRNKGLSIRTGFLCLCDSLF